MGRRWVALVAAGLVAMVIVAGCGGGGARDTAGGPSVEVLALRPPMTEAVVSLGLLVDRLDAGTVPSARNAYTAYTDAFGQVLGPISLRDPELAREVANANTALKELMRQAAPDRTAVREQAQIIVGGLHRAAEVMGISLTANASAEIGDAADKERRTFTVKADEYRFSPDRLEVEAGTEVTIKLMNVGTMRHEFEMEALGTEIEPIAPGASGQITFVVKKPGTYDFVCDIDDHEHRGMKGTLVVR